MAADRGCLRLLLAVPVTLLTVIAASLCWAALTIRPSGTWDDDAYAAITLSCVLAIGAAGAVAALWLAPSVRWALPRWWMLPAVLSAVVAGVRWAVGG